MTREGGESLPKWGLTPEQRDQSPWGLPADVLQPSKTITDPIHGDVYLTRLERLVLDSPALQRLRRVRQLGSTHLVYPGATHSRFSHSLGALRAAQDLLDAVLDHRNGPHRVPDLFEEWESEPETFEKRVAEATVLARLGALLHDMCHVPYGHTVEDDLQILEAHDKNVARFERLWSQLGGELLNFFSGDLAAALRPLILSKEEERDATDKEAPTSEAAHRYPFVADIVGNTICADLLDYLRRDHEYTGLPAKLGHRFIDGFYVTRSDHKHAQSRMVVQITRQNRHLRADVVSELFKYLRYRYELSERALVHHAKLAADAMVGKLLQLWSDALYIETAREQVKGLSAKEGRDRSAIDARLNEDQRKAVLIEQRRRMEEEFTRRSDDGLLEHLLDQTKPVASSDGRQRAIASLATDLQNRRLFKLIGRCASAQPRAKAIYNDYSDPEGRRRLEEDVAKYAGLAEGWHVVLWIPTPSMRLKPAQVLVDDGRLICELQDWDRREGNRGREIYDSHEALWAVSVFAHPSVARDETKVKVVLAWLARELGLRWDGTDEETPERIAVARASHQLELTRPEEALVLERLQAGVQARGGGDPSSSFPSLLDTAIQIGKSLRERRQGEGQPADADEKSDRQQENRSLFDDK